MIASLLLATMLAQTDVRDLFEKMRSERIEERDDASRALLDLDAPPVAEIEKAAASERDAEVRGRLKGALEEIGRRERVAAVRPRTRPLTLEFHNEPFDEAVRKSLGPFGLTSVEWSEEVGRRRVTLHLKGATFWQAVEALGRAASAYGSRGASRWHFQDRAPAMDSVGGFDVSEALIFAEQNGREKHGDGPWKNDIVVQVLLPPGFSPSSAQVEDGLLLDDQGHAIEADRTPGGTTNRVPGGVGKIRAMEFAVLPENLKAARSLQVKGTLLLRYPHDLERHEFALQGLKTPLSVKFQGSSLTIASIQIDPDRQCQLNFVGRAESARLLVFSTLEDERGKWLSDLDHTNLESGSSVSGNCSASIPPGAAPARFVLNRILGEDEVRIPFHLKNVPPPPHPPKG
jgi:hypothetical protein